MKNILKFGLVALLVIGLVLAFAGPVMAQNNKSTVIKEPFTVDPSAPGYKIPRGSTIHHLENGMTEVYGSGNSLLLRASDSEAAMISTPSGLAAATDIVTVPSGSDIESRGNITDVYQNGTLILRVFDAGPLPPARKANTSFNGWVEYAYDWSPDSRGSSSDINLNSFTANWNVPSSPTDSASNEVDYLFNAIENYRGSEIIQPVLGWNTLGTGAYPGWYVASWYGPYHGQYFFSTPKKATEGDSILGTLSYSSSTSKWTITISDNSASNRSSASLSTNVIGTKSLAVFCTLEGYNIVNNTDVPGATTFSNMSFGYAGPSASITWASYANPTALKLVPGLNVNIVSQNNEVTLNTGN